MTPSDETILAAARDMPGLASIEYVNGPATWRTDDNGIIALYNAAYATGQRAGMEAAAVLCKNKADEMANNRLIVAASGAVQCADAIRSAIKGDV